MGTYTAKKQLQGVQETNQANRDIASETNAMNLQLAREENEFNERMWNLTNQYNDPAKQAQRLRGAGLSQSAAAQAASGFEANTIQSANLANQQIGAPMVAPPSEAYAGFNVVGLMREAVSLMEQTKDLEMKATEQKYQEPMLISKQDAQYLNNALNKRALFEGIQTWPYRLSSAMSQAKSDAVQPEYVDAQKNYVEEQTRLAQQQFGFLLHKNQKELAEFDKKLRNMDEEYNNLVKSGKLISANISNVAQSTENLKAEGKVLAEDWLKQHLENSLRKFGYPETSSQKIGALVASGDLKISEVIDYQKSIVDFIDSQGHYFNGSDDARIFWYKVMNEGISKEESYDAFKQITNALTNKNLPKKKRKLPWSYYEVDGQ